MTGPFSGLWRYRMADCRINCEIVDRKLVVTVLKVDHRAASVYR